jgi:hypothetical protein
MPKTKKKVVEPVLEEVKIDPPIKKERVRLVSYAIKMVIPTGAYANIQPEITVKGGTLEEAHAYCAPHMNKLWKEYYLISEKRPEVNQEVKKPEPVGGTGGNANDSKAGLGYDTTPPPPVSSVSFQKASQAITSCLSLEAFNLIADQVEASVKLTNEDKTMLMPILEKKFNELNGNIK